MAKSSPLNLSELMERAHNMAGIRLADIAADNRILVPVDLRRDKGWVGQLIESELGALAGSKPEQDFLHLGVELKTIPIGHKGKPLETTYVTVAPLTNIQGMTWENSVVYHKLQRVLWIPVEGERSIPVGDRRIGTPILWQPNTKQAKQLQQDWEEIMELIALGQVDKITARQGEVLQLRPKAANSQILTESIAEDGSIQLSNPRGFYLKIDFTQQILTNAFS
ncbi:MAG: DNA mismatch repair endonuclease MutH [Shewanella psychromarinicola]|jgi:DNA mismatch repair protein MutH|uniref:DNA mismatch repair protein MutH n=1 Tax=Shewanella psychromarinicola TaxID=2487742 RepID=A0A3N4E840_9GAMM|nr:DNA mismatch repair endonuclease MutH [Shewanella psychromarinicola]AZG35255.1 DNA mismatch repair endonuclease MutH [Shewanella psychromarinicola]MCL1081647.1 DNA mismatch repair endonuclease MutH [Shewanella psychromarinicola]RPA32942.1 DNA mismatch repair endonuclease MutH [Shewanella psychromarinicola]